MLHKNQIPTPALLVDLDKFEANLALMARRAHEGGKRLRPHAKAHKCVEIARRQIAAGACGICCATVSEAELMSNAGIHGLLLTSPLADVAKMARAVKTGAMVVVDHVTQVAWYEAAARREVEVLVDLDVGDHRTGAASLEQALEIAHAVDRAAHLRLRGVQAYSVSGSHASGEERRRISSGAFQVAAGVRDAMKRDGLCCDIVSGGSTGTWEVDLGLPDVTEFQAGSYALMDIAYRRLGVDFQNAMTIQATVISANHEKFVTVDAGFKAFSTDRPFGPEAVDLPGSGYRWGGDEHGYVDLGDRRLLLGDRVEFVPPHCDPTVNLYDRIYAYRGERVEAIWPVMDRTREVPV